MIKILMNVLPIAATFFLVACYVPQVIQTFKTKDVKSISLAFFAMLNVALTLLLINSIILFTQNGNFGYVFSYICNESLAFAMLVMILKYRKN